MEVSSVNCPGARWNGPPPTMSVRGAKEPRGLNSTVVPMASQRPDQEEHLLRGEYEGCVRCWSCISVLAGLRHMASGPGRFRKIDFLAPDTR